MLSLSFSFEQTKIAVVGARMLPGLFYSIPDQVNAFLWKHNGEVPPDALYFISGGGNDIVSLFSFIGVFIEYPVRNV